MAVVLRCRCGVTSQASDEIIAWEKHREHVVDRTLRGDGAVHDVVATSKPHMYPEPPPVEWPELVHWMAQTAHQAYHDDQNMTYNDCPHSICMAASRALKEHAE